jgi:hypothetical protein
LVYHKLEFLTDIPTKFQKTAVINVERSGKSLKFALHPSVNAGEMELDLSVQTGDIRLLDPELEFLYMTAIELNIQNTHDFEIVGDGQKTYWKSTYADSKLSLPSIAANSELKSRFQYLLPESKSVEHIVKVILRDTLPNGQKIVYSKVVHLQLTRPFQLSYTLSHTAESTFLQYHIFGHETLPVRIKSVTWSPSELIKSYKPENNTLLFPNQKLTFLSVIDAAVVKEKLNMKLHIEYQLISKEVQHFIMQRCEYHTCKHEVPLACGLVKKFAKRNLFSKINPFDLCYYGKMKLPQLDTSSVLAELINVSVEQRRQLQTAIEDLNSELASIADSVVKPTVAHLQSDLIIYTQTISPCAALISASWTPLQDLKYVPVGELVHYTLQITSTIWRSSSPINFILVIHPEHNRLALGGKLVSKLRIEVIFSSCRMRMMYSPSD